MHWHAWTAFVLLVMLTNMTVSVRLLKVPGKLHLKTLSRPLNTATPIEASQTAPVPRIQKTGGFFQQLPEIYPSDVYFKKAWKQTRELKVDKSIKNVRNANRKHAAQVMDSLMKALTAPITNVLKIYNKDIKALHPYEVSAPVSDILLRSY
jgi:hypothetical protein